MPLDILLEGLLFYKAAPITKASIQKQFSVTDEELAVSLTAIRARLESGALRLLETESEIQLVTAPELAPFIESVRKAELKKDIGKAGAETLAIILYKGKVSRAEIDRIRGVNSSFILRALMVRGLITRSGGEGGSHLYAGTTELLAHLGASRKEELVDFARITDALEAFSAETAA